MTTVYLRNTAQSIGDEKEFRTFLATQFQKEVYTSADSSECSIIKTISVVGAPTPYGVKYEGGDEDSVRLRHILNYVARTKVASINPQFEIDTVDFNTGRDFLREEKQTDLLFISCVPASEQSLLKQPVIIDDKGLQSMRDRGSAFDQAQQMKLADSLSVHHTRQKWVERLKSSKASLCVTFGGCAEISTNYLANDLYEDVITTPNRTIRGWTTPYESAEEFYGHPNDYPMLWLGMMKRTKCV